MDSDDMDEFVFDCSATGASGCTFSWKVHIIQLAANPAKKHEAGVNTGHETDIASLGVVVNFLGGKLV
jgi:hypothetical protein